MSKVSRFDLVAWGVLVFLLIFSLVRIPYLPQYVDGYYHLSTANAFVKSGGWVSWAWWDFAPFGRPHLYPPLYHILLAFLIKLGFPGILSLQVTEGLVVPIFFFVFWFVIRRMSNARCAFFSLFILSGFFSFFTSVSGNVPATIALILGLLSLLFFSRGYFLNASIFLAGAFYAHAAVPWMFIAAYLFSLGLKAYRLRAMAVMIMAIFLALPFLFHEIFFLNSIHLVQLGEQFFTRFSLLMIIMGIVGLVVCFCRSSLLCFLIVGFTVGAAIVFSKYPYRFFSAQGMMMLGVAAGLFCDYILSLPARRGIYLSLLCGLFITVFFHPVLERDGGKTDLGMQSTYGRLISGRVDDFMFNSIYVPRIYLPALKAIEKYCSSEDIIISNMRITGQVYSALSGRPNGYSMLGEIKASRPNYALAKAIIWSKQDITDKIDAASGKFIKVFDGDVDAVFINQGIIDKARVLPAACGFNFIVGLLALWACVSFWELRILGKRMV